MYYVICSSLAVIFLSTILKIVWTHKILNPFMQASFIWFLLETKLSAHAIFEGISYLHTSFCLPILLDFGWIYRMINRLRRSYSPFSVFSKLSCTNICKWIVERFFYKRELFFFFFSSAIVIWIYHCFHLISVYLYTKHFCCVLPPSFTSPP